jgi:hypothetical protein
MINIPDRQIKFSMHPLAPIQLTLIFITALTIANLPFLWLENSTFISRAVINLDLALALCILPKLPIAGMILLALAWGAEWIVNAATTFHFGAPAEFLQSIRYAATLNYEGLIHWSAIISMMLFTAAGSLLFFITRKRNALWKPGIVTILFLIIIDVVNGSSALSSHSSLHYPINLAGSPSFTLIMSMAQTSEVVPLRQLPRDDTVQGLVDIPAWAAGHPDRGILFVIIESLGIPKDPTIREWVRSQWVDPGLLQRFEVFSADVPFKGSTTSGELRSLCMLAGSYRSVDVAQGANCLPAQLAASGWSTIGMHGFSGRMFDRANWWPKIGLQTTLFGEAPEFQTLRCGITFRGGCDSTLLANGFKALAPRRFIYLLTLNTHLPFERPAEGTPIPPGCQSSESNTEVCDHISATTAVLRQIRKELEKTSTPPLVVVIGDHAAPFSNKNSRQAFLADQVPAAVLVPR